MWEREREREDFHRNIFKCQCTISANVYFILIKCQWFLIWLTLKQYILWVSVYDMLYDTWGVQDWKQIYKKKVLIWFLIWWTKNIFPHLLTQNLNSKWYQILELMNINSGYRSFLFIFLKIIPLFLHIELTKCLVSQRK